MDFPSTVSSETELEDVLSEPYSEDIELAFRLDGDVMLLGAAGKMGPTLAKRIGRAVEAGGSGSRVYAVSRFSDDKVKQNLESHGLTTIASDLLSDTGLRELPDCRYVVFMAGAKFGTTGNEDQTWAINAYLPGNVIRRFPKSQMVAFSTGNVYPLVPVDSGGCKETDPTGPVGEYAQSTLGRERVLSFFARRNQTPLCLLRLNYAVEPRYGVLLDIGQAVYSGQPVSLAMGYVNVIWQGDANSAAFRALELCESPPAVLNVTGLRTLSVREIAEQFARHFDKDVAFTGEEATTSLLNNAGQCHERFDLPRVTVEQVIELTAGWIRSGGRSLGKPTKFQVRDGKF